jgi:hypothetical protein
MRRALDQLTGGAPIAAPGVVAGPRGEAYAGWLSAGRRGAVRVLVARSLDGGRTWSRARAPLPSRTKAFAPALAVSPDGTVGLTAYRLLAGGRADVVSARSRDGVSWAVARLTPRFSLRRSPRAGVAQSFIGDYTGLAARPGGFAAALSLGPPTARRGAADVFVASFAALP